MRNPDGVARRLRIPHDDLAAAWSSITDLADELGITELPDPHAIYDVAVA